MVGWDLIVVPWYGLRLAVSGVDGESLANCVAAKETTAIVAKGRRLRTVGVKRRKACPSALEGREPCLAWANGLW